MITTDLNPSFFESNESYNTLKKELLDQRLLKSPTKNIQNINLRDFLSFSMGLFEDYLIESKSKNSNSNFNSLISFLPYHLEKKFKYSTNNRAQISEFLTNFTITLENFSPKSGEVSLISILLLQNNIPQKKLAFYVKARKSIIAFLCLSQRQPDDLDNIELTLNEWSTLTNRLFNEFKGFADIMKGVTERIKASNLETTTLHRKNSIFVVKLLEIWLEFFDKFYKNDSPLKKHQIKSPNKCIEFININSNPSNISNSYNSNNTNDKNNSNNTNIINNNPDNSIDNNESANNKRIIIPPNSYYKKLIQRDRLKETPVLVDRDEKFSQNYTKKCEDFNTIRKSILNMSLIDCDEDKLGEFMKQDSNKFKVLNMLLKIIGECEGLLQVFSHIFVFLEDLKENVKNINKAKDQKVLNDKIKNFQIPRKFEDDFSIQKLSFCKKSIQEYIKSLENTSFSKIPSADINSTIQVVKLNFPIDVEKKDIKKSASIKKPQNAHLKHDIIKGTIEEYLKNLNTKVLEKIFISNKKNDEINEELKQNYKTNKKEFSKSEKDENIPKDFSKESQENSVENENLSKFN